jgi:large subunit ribosomal protein LP1
LIKLLIAFVGYFV